LRPEISAEDVLAMQPNGVKPDHKNNNGAPNPKRRSTYHLKPEFRNSLSLRGFFISGNAEIPTVPR
jgi:hypothetical protein